MHSESAPDRSLSQVVLGASRESWGVREGGQFSREINPACEAYPPAQGVTPMMLLSLVRFTRSSLLTFFRWAQGTIGVFCDHGSIVK